MTLTAAELDLVDRWQRDFPLVEHPFASVGRSVGLDEDTTIATFTRLREQGVISRIGAVVKPNTVGASTLAAMRVPAGRIDEVAAIVSAEPLVTHNYEREHPLNLWFVIAGPHSGAVGDVIARIERRTALLVFNLPLLKAFHLDLGFSLKRRPVSGEPRMRPVDYQPDLRDRGVLAAIEDGLPLVQRPYRDVGRQINLGEPEVIDRLQQLTAVGIVARFGCVVRHRVLGYMANAMVVWDVPDDVVDVVAGRIVGNPQVTLCYCRPRRLPDWPYNLFCMVHAKSRDEALAVIDDLNAIAEAGLYDRATLFSTRCFKQRGAVFSEPAARLH